MGRRPNMSKIALCLTSALASIYAVPAFAQEQQASARGLIEITRSVGTGIAFDVLTDTLSGVFLTGQVGDSVSLLLPPRRAAGSARGRIPGEVVVLSTASYSFDIAGNAPPASQDNGDAHLQPAGYDSSPGNLLFLAQFN